MINFSNDFTNVKVGDKVIIELDIGNYGHPKLHTMPVEHVTKTTFQLQGYGNPPKPKSGKVYKKEGGILYPKDRYTSRAIVWTQEIQDAYEEKVRIFDEKLQLQGSIGNSVAKLGEFANRRWTYDLEKLRAVEIALKGLVEAYDHRKSYQE